MAIKNVAIAPIVGELQRNNLLPAIVFRTSRVQCDTDVERAAKNRKLHIDRPRQNELKAEIERIATNYETDIELIKSHPHYASLVTTAIGAHHAGQLLTWRLVLEELMSAGLLKVLVATGTVAAGVDFPARTVVVTAHSRRGADGYEDLTSAELQQMSGRAGRRGKDTVGFCMSAPSLFCDARTVAKIASRPPAPLRSAYYPAPSTVLNLLRYRNVDDLRFTVQRSLASFTDKKAAAELREESLKINENLEAEMSADVSLEKDQKDPNQKKSNSQKGKQKKARRLIRKAEELESQQNILLERALTGLNNLGYLDGASLSDKGYFAAQLCTSMVIELAEILEAGLFDNLGPDKLAILVGSICGDSYRKYLQTEKTHLDEKTIQTLEEIIAKVAAEKMPGVLEDRQVLQDCATTIAGWMDAEDWIAFRSLLTLTGVAEGDAARLISQTADHLNQLARLSESHPEIAKTALIAKMKLLRPPLSDNLVLVQNPTT